jgi:hypothetical protein
MSADDTAKTFLDGVRVGVSDMFTDTEPPILATFSKMNGKKAKVYPDGWQDEEGNRDSWDDVLVLKHVKNDLQKGDRVLLAFINGEIDNPLIVGVL